jgi:hypothetical protein
MAPEEPPIVVAAAPLALRLRVPSCVTAPRVDVPVTPKVPLTVRLVTLRAAKVVVPSTVRVPSIVALVPTVRVVPVVRLVVVVKEPGTVIALGREKVIVLPDPVVVISPDVPARVMLPPPVGLIAPPESPVRVLKAPADTVIVQVADTVPPKEERLVKV